MDVDSHVACGQLVILTGDQTYVRDGVFDPQAMIVLLRSEMEKALDELLRQAT